MLENELAPLYNELSNEVIITIPKDWTEVHYLGEVESQEKSTASIFYFKEKNGNNNFIRSNDIPDIYNVSEAEYDKHIDNMDTIIVKMYREFIDNKQAPWDQIKMSLTPDGKFNVDFIYGALQNMETRLMNL
ncbi:DUF600 family protein [Periweissella cryptocerci]|uniref:DUF600 family protein n=1 Tax=Periweissella cryptocerci TaxID=2506420 RepID=A0A4P6YT41_9LACO|nr:immunity protein YezG family protein [Periweissella cryptocerci]QBO35840.1 DUF600 family protein [Periweissella cryptocerci]